MRVQRGPSPRLTGEVIYENPYFRMTREAFVFTTPGGARIHYRQSAQVTLECPDPSLEGECQLYLWGTVMGAVAWLNGMMPLHCSAVEHGGSAIAFTAPSGGGKSTLAAALASRGFRHLCDDTLVIAEQDGTPFAILDGKPAKLWSDALGLAGVEAGGEVPLLPGKHYAEPPVPHCEPCPLKHFIILEQGDEVSLEPITGADKLEQLAEAIYRGFVHTARGDHDFHAHMMLLIAQNVRFWILRRPLDVERFDELTDDITTRLSRLEAQG
ncbi:hypothetical protein [Altererythrobacter sp. Z27]|uniref:hypothetical protein n=1 Tax=Altererythrobacter sp. Z27 TaxID=3461147 RepID=UPI0040447B11